MPLFDQIVNEILKELLLLRSGITFPFLQIFPDHSSDETNA
jgi:hypothetical protein